MILANDNQDNTNLSIKRKMSKGAKNLSNIDFNNRKTCLETPKSKQALLELGLIESDLFKLDIKEYLAMNPQLKTESKKNQEKRYNHYEEKRKEAIEEAKKKREEIIKSINNSNKEQEKKSIVENICQTTNVIIHNINLIIL